MTTVIRLDTNAVMSLFPEGSEQRLELTRAVTAQVVRHVIEKDANAVAKTLEQEARLHTHKALESLGIVRVWNGNVNLTEEAKAAISGEAVRQVNSQVLMATGTEVAGRVRESLTDERIDHIVERALEGVVRKALDTRWGTVINDIFKKEI